QGGSETLRPVEFGGARCPSHPLRCFVSMSLIIDGYNLLNASGIVASSDAGTSLHQSRSALLDFLANRLNREERRVTTVVFDARHAPPGLQPTYEYRDMTVRFARPHREADDLIEELICQNTSPRQLTVVSGDHRLHRAARRRRAMPIDSDVWFRRLARRSEQAADSVDLPDEADTMLSAEEIEAWLRSFSDLRPQPPQTSEPPGNSSRPTASGDFENPFPPGYGEDLLNGEGEP
ncbi:MAG: NYN domain-containing protein, partial [Planctomycetes bacterium]|nr:NYN domain-containing protein [Planctomycetota bacterium]